MVVFALRKGIFRERWPPLIYSNSVPRNGGRPKCLEMVFLAKNRVVLPGQPSTEEKQND
jgi:hypothetical protein